MFLSEIIVFLTLLHSGLIFLLNLDELSLLGTAYIFEKSLVTFDGKPIYLPKDILGRYKDCKYLLTRDFQWKNFTVYLHDGKFVVEMKDGKVVVDRKNGNKVYMKISRHIRSVV